MIFLASDHSGNILGKEICELWNNLGNFETELDICLDINLESNLVFGNLKEESQNFVAKSVQKFDCWFDKMENLTKKLDPNDDYPDIAKLLAQKINYKNIKKKPKKENILENNSTDFEQRLEKKPNSDFGIAICGTGQGICMGLNRFKKIRAGVLSCAGGENLEKSLTIVEFLRFHNNANVLCLSSSIPVKIAIILIQRFIKTLFSKEIRHIRRIKKLDNLR